MIVHIEKKNSKESTKKQQNTKPTGNLLEVSKFSKIFGLEINLPKPIVFQ